jgi:hypothetical protein
MRLFILTLAVLAGLLVIPARHAGSSASPEMAIGTAVLDAHALEAQQVPQINVEINQGGARRWYENPVWMAIGGLALVMLIVLIVMATKGGGTTVVKG